jgi:hypothetical protein
MHMSARRSRVPAFVGGAAVTALVAGGLGVAGVALFNPFERTTVDRTPPPVMEQLRDMAEFRAASAEYQVLVDLEEDVEHIPSALAGERTFFIGIGSVDAAVDFSGLTDRTVVVSPDGKTISVRLPAATLTDPVLDLEQSHVVARERGLFDRIAGAINSDEVDDRPLYLAAEEKIGEEAVNSELLSRAEANTREMLVAMLKAAGFETVVVQFDRSAAA